MWYVVVSFVHFSRFHHVVAIWMSHKTYETAAEKISSFILMLHTVDPFRQISPKFMRRLKYNGNCRIIVHLSMFSRTRAHAQSIRSTQSALWWSHRFPNKQEISQWIWSTHARTNFWYNFFGLSLSLPLSFSLANRSDLIHVNRSRYNDVCMWNEPNMER